MQAINKGLEKVVQELSLSENDGPVSEKFHKVIYAHYLQVATSLVTSSIMVLILLLSSFRYKNK